MNNIHEYEMDKLITEVYTKVDLGYPIAAVDLLIDQIDKLFTDNEISCVKMILNRIDVNRLPPQVLSGILSLTWHGKEVLGDTRIKFFERSMDALKNTWKLSIERLNKIEERLK